MKANPLRKEETWETSSPARKQDRIIVENYGDCVAEIDDEDLAALARGESLLFVIRDEYTLEISLSKVVPSDGEASEEFRKRKRAKASERRKRIEGVVIESDSFRDGIKPPPDRGSAWLEGIVGDATEDDDDEE